MTEARGTAVEGQGQGQVRGIRRQRCPALVACDAASESAAQSGIPCRPALIPSLAPMTRRQTATVVFIVLCVVLVAAAVSLNVGWILVNGRRVLPLVLGIMAFALIIAGIIVYTVFLVRELRRNEQQDALHQRGHARAEDADRVDPPVPGNAAGARGRRGAAAGVLQGDAGRRRSAAAHGRTGAARPASPGSGRELGTAPRSTSAALARGVHRDRAAPPSPRRRRHELSLPRRRPSRCWSRATPTSCAPRCRNLLDNAVKYSRRHVQVTRRSGRARARHAVGARARPRRRHPARAAASGSSTASTASRRAAST